MEKVDEVSDERKEKVRGKVMDMVSLSENRLEWKQVLRKIQDNFSNETDKMIGAMILGFKAGKEKQAKDTKTELEGRIPQVMEKVKQHLEK